MAIKFTLQGALIYATMAGYLIAIALLLMKRRKAAMTAYAAGFVLASCSLILRWVHVGHTPLQNLFEVFLVLGALAFPLSLLCRRFLRIAGEGGDMMVGVVVLFPAGFVFGAEPQLLPPALQSPFFAPHVLAYMMAYVIMTKATVQAVLQLTTGDAPGEEGLVSREVASYNLIRMGFPLLTIGLILGSCWGKLAWGRYWNWDPKEMWSLATWLVYVFYFHFRYSRRGRSLAVNAAITIAGMVLIVITLLWVNLSRIFTGLHNYAA